MRLESVTSSSAPDGNILCTSLKLKADQSFIHPVKYLNIYETYRHKYLIPGSHVVNNNDFSDPWIFG